MGPFLIVLKGAKNEVLIGALDPVICRELSGTGGLWMKWFGVVDPGGVEIRESGAEWLNVPSDLGERRDVDPRNDLCLLYTSPSPRD